MPADQLSDLAGLFAPLAGFQRVGVAVSGGADSLALMLLCAAWRRADPSAPVPIVYSVDHGLRPEAATEVAFVLEEARSLGLQGRGLRWDDAKPEAGIQAAARAARYCLIGNAMAADGAEALLTAHHLEDQAETVLMRLAHGSGLEGLKGMQTIAQVAGLTIVRPLLGTSRAALAEIVAAAGLTPVADPSNTDTSYERVRWRQQLPRLAELGLTPERLALFAARAGDADEALAAAATRVAVRSAHRIDAGGMAIGRADFLRPPRAVGLRVLARLLDQVGGATKPHDLGAVEALYGRLTAVKVLRPLTLHGCIVACDGESVMVRPEPGRRQRNSRQATEPMGT